MKPNVPHMRVAVLDEDETLLSMMYELLTDQGFIVEVFTSVNELKKALYHEPFNMIFADVGIANLSVRDLLTYLQEINSSAAIIPMASADKVPLALEVDKPAVYGYLSKPLANLDQVVHFANQLATGLLDHRRGHEISHAITDKIKQVFSRQKKSLSTEEFQKIMLRVDSLIKNLHALEAGKDNLGQILSGRLDDLGPAVLVQLFSALGKSGKLLFYGELHRGEITFVNGKIANALCGRFKAERAVFRLFNQERGPFQFVLTANEVLHASDIQMPPEALIMDCLRRLEEYRALGQRIPPDHLQLRVRQPAGAPISSQERRILEIATRFPMVKDILEFSPEPELETIRSLLRLRMAGLLEPLPAQAHPLPFGQVRR